MTDAIAVTQEVELAASTKDAPEILSWDSRVRRTITIYIPLSIFVIVLLFPFYWMAITSVKPDYEMYDYKKYNPFWVHSPTLDNIRKLLFETEYPHWLLTHDGHRDGSHLPVGRCQRAGCLCDRTSTLQGCPARRAGDLPGLSGAADHPVHSAGDADLPVRHVRQAQLR